jgi:RHS repeat-associated protein
MQRMVTAPIPLYSPNDITRAQSRAGGWIASFDFDGPPTSTPAVTAMTTSTGAIAERYAYTAYGQPTILNASGTPLSPQTSTLNSRYSYTGREWDATLGLHHFRARWMSPMTGRFLGRDPIGYEGEDNDLYEYVGSNSLVFVDSLGNLRVRPDYDDEPHHHPCGLKFSWMLPDPSKIQPVDTKFGECVARKIAQGKSLKDALKLCAEEVLKGLVKKPKDQLLTWYGYAYCCEVYKYTDKFDDGDPCGHATPNSLPPGTPPQGPCWKSPFPDKVPNGPWPIHCFECCELRACVGGIMGVLGNKPNPFSEVECKAECPHP